MVVFFKQKWRVHNRNRKSRKHPLGNIYLNSVQKLQKSLPNWHDIFNETLHFEDRAQEMIRSDVIGSNLCNKYAWAIPDKRAIKILAMV
jgi:hypothetical protein